MEKLYDILMKDRRLKVHESFKALVIPNDHLHYILQELLEMIKVSHMMGANNHFTNNFS